jgi:hypothetical protein
VIKFHFHTDPDLDFYPETHIPLENSNVGNLDNFIFNLGLIEMISYWKATCSPKIIIKAGKLAWENFFTKTKLIFWIAGFLKLNPPLIANLVLLKTKARMGT